jgi:hypothetical protein
VKVLGSRVGKSGGDEHHRGLELNETEQAWSGVLDLDHQGVVLKFFEEPPAPE